jgi:peptidoglycan/xylan/chitin deacetylase (PgdA/CDA1 family)
MDTLDYVPGKLPAYELPRNFEGYGENPPDPEWPNGARIAVSFVLNVEEGAEHNILHGDDRSEAYIWEKGGLTTEIINGRHLMSEGEFEYGSRAGGWRLLRTFKEFGYHMTIYAVAQSLAKNHSFGKALVRDGHEIANHGLRWINWAALNDEEQIEMVQKAVLLLEEVTGEAPVGAYIGRANIKTPAIVHEAHRRMGKPLLWESDAYADDVPYWMDLPQENDLSEEEKTGLLMIPYAYVTNDYKFVASSPGPGFPGAMIYEDYLKQEFDQLYREGGRMMNIPMHSRIMGKPGRTNALRNFLKYISEKEDVWVCTRRDIANHFKEKFPYKSGKLAFKRE